MKELNVKNVIITKQGEESSNYQEFKRIIKEKNINVINVGVTNLGAPPKIKIDKNIYFDILWPKTTNLINENILNNNSIVCKLHYNDFTMLLTGDIEEIAEQQVISQYKNTNYLKSTILKVAHHGSKTSSTQDFIKAVSPQIALIGVGKNNKFGHPNAEVVQRLKTFGAQIYRTDEMGEISITVNSNGKIKVKNFLHNVSK